MQDVTAEAVWSTSDSGVATVVAGLATGQGDGSTQVTATFDGMQSDPVTLNVGAAGAALEWWAILAIIAGVLGAGFFLIFLFGRRRGIEQEA